MNKNILVIEDDLDVAKVLHHTLQAEGYSVEIDDKLESSLEKAKSKEPALIILDLIMPDTDGLEICRQLKRDPQTAEVPILILSSRSQESDVVSGLELGAEDYITKPFSPRVLLARVRTILRRNHSESVIGAEKVVYYGEFKVDPHRFEISCGTDMIAVTRSEFRILYLLFSRPGWVFTRKQILEATHGEETPVTVRSVDVMVVNLRQKLNSRGHLLETVRGVGYRVKDLKASKNAESTKSAKSKTEVHKETAQPKK